MPALGMKESTSLQTLRTCRQYQGNVTSTLFGSKFNFDKNSKVKKGTNDQNRPEGTQTLHHPRFSKDSDFINNHD